MQVSAAIGLAAIGAISTGHSRVLAAEGLPVVNALAGGYQLAFTIAATCVAMALLVVLVVLRPSRSAGPQGSRAELDEAA
jgi:hypothetical protein